MYCLINAKGCITEVDTLIKNFSLKPKQSYTGGEYFTGKYRNLRIWADWSGQYEIKGSIWVFAKGNNHSGFIYEELLECVSELNSLTLGTYENADVIGYEFAINMNTQYDPVNYLANCISSTVNSRDYPLYPHYDEKRGKLWGIDTLGNFNGYKLYSKSHQSNLNVNLLRCEYYVSNVKGAFKSTLKVKELLNTSFISKQYDRVREFILGINMKMQFDPNYMAQLEGSDKWRYLALCNTNIKDPNTLFDLMGIFHPQKRYREKVHISRIRNLEYQVCSLKQELISIVGDHSSNE